MKLTRRHVLGAGCLAVPAMAAVGFAKNRHGATVSSRMIAPAAAATPDAGALVLAFDGLSGFVTSPGDTMVDVVLPRMFNAETSSAHAHVARHYGTLAVPRGRIVSSSEPAGVHGTQAFYGLDGMRVSITPRESADATSPVSLPARVNVNRQAISDAACPSMAREWNSFNWVLDFAKDVYPGVLARDWRQRNDFVNALIELRHGVLEDSRLPSGVIGSSQNVRRWRLKSGATRGLKEVVRVMISNPRFVHVTMTPLTGNAAPGHVVLDCTTQWIEATIGHLPVPGNAMDDAPLHDLQAFLGMFANGDPAGPAFNDKTDLPVAAGGTCATAATSDCGCCPPITLEDPNWMEA